MIAHTKECRRVINCGRVFLLCPHSIRLWVSPIHQFFVAWLVCAPWPEAGGPASENFGRNVFLTSTPHDFFFPMARGRTDLFYSLVCFAWARQFQLFRAHHAAGPTARLHAALTRGAGAEARRAVASNFSLGCQNDFLSFIFCGCQNDL